ncbi:MAG: MFS transporter [Acidobacteria bacterium]|nr:MFS transporter [Acidobacteriota bacterium]
MESGNSPQTEKALAMSEQPSTTVSARPTGIRWLVLALACTTSWLLYLHRYSWGVIKPEVKSEFGFSDTQLGWLDSAFNLSYALFQVPGGLLGDLLGPAIVLPVIIFAWSGCVAGTAMVGQPWSFAAVRTLFGLTQAGAYSNISKVTRSWFPLSVRTTAQGLIGSFSGRAGGASAALVVGTLLLGWMQMEWRAAMWWLALAGIGFAAAFRLLFTDSPAGHPWTNSAEQALVDGEEPVQTPASGAAPRLDLSRPALGNLAMLMLHGVASAGADMLYVYWIPLFLSEAKGFDPVQMGIFASLPLWGGAAGGAFAGVLNDRLIRLRGRKFARKAVGLTGKVLASILVLISLDLEDGRLIMVLLAGAKFLTDWSQPTVWGTITDIAGPVSGRIFGAVNMAGSLGAFVAGPVLGWIKQRLGWSILFQTIAGAYVFAGLCWLAIDATRKVFTVGTTLGTAPSSGSNP